MRYIDSWLTGLGLEYIIPKLKANGITTPKKLAQLTLRDMYEVVGVEDAEDRKKLYFLIQRLQTILNSRGGGENEHENPNDDERSPGVQKQQTQQTQLNNDENDRSRGRNSNASSAYADDDDDIADEDVQQVAGGGARPRRHSSASAGAIITSPPLKRANGDSLPSSSEEIITVPTKTTRSSNNNNNALKMSCDSLDRSEEDLRALRQKLKQGTAAAIVAAASNTSSSTAMAAATGTPGKITKQGGVALIKRSSSFRGEPSSSSSSLGGPRPSSLVRGQSFAGESGGAVSVRVNGKAQVPVIGSSEDGSSSGSNNRSTPPAVPAAAVARVKGLTKAASSNALMSPLPQPARKASSVASPVRPQQQQQPKSNSATPSRKASIANTFDNNNDYNIRGDKISPTRAAPAASAAAVKPVAAQQKSAVAKPASQPDFYNHNNQQQQQQQRPATSSREQQERLRQEQEELIALQQQQLEDEREARARIRDGLAVEDMAIRVVVRKRPISTNEGARGDRDVMEIGDAGYVLVHEPKVKVDLTKIVETTPFVFDDAFDASDTNERIYARTVRHLVNFLFDGGKASCFAYGQTGSGKTFTMMGSNPANPSQVGQNAGLYVLAARDIFKLLAQPDYCNLRLMVSCFEIYGGKLLDLLNERSQIKCLEDAKQQVQLPGLTEHQVFDVDELLELMARAHLQRSTGSTGANAESSRSHQVMQLVLRDPPTPPPQPFSRLKKPPQTPSVKSLGAGGKLSFIDLAGSERGADTRHASKQTRMEGAEINTSLLALKEVIRSLEKKHGHTPFRGSKLTQVLKDSFVGDKSRCCMIACVSPSHSNCEHTLNTLRYADRVKEHQSSNLGGGGGVVPGVVAPATAWANEQQQGDTPRPTTASNGGQGMPTKQQLQYLQHAQAAKQAAGGGGGGGGGGVQSRRASVSGEVTTAASAARNTQHREDLRRQSEEEQLMTQASSLEGAPAHAHGHVSAPRRNSSASVESYAVHKGDDALMKHGRRPSAIAAAALVEEEEDEEEEEEEEHNDDHNEEELEDRHHHRNHLQSQSSRGGAAAGGGGGNSGGESHYHHHSTHDDDGEPSSHSTNYPSGDRSPGKAARRRGSKTTTAVGGGSVPHSPKGHGGGTEDLFCSTQLIEHTVELLSTHKHAIAEMVELMKDEMEIVQDMENAEDRDSEAYLDRLEEILDRRSISIDTLRLQLIRFQEFRLAQTTTQATTGGGGGGQSTGHPHSYDDRF